MARLIVLGMIVQLFVIGYVFYQSYEGRVHVVVAQRAGCERSKLDRKAVIILGQNTLDNFKETDRIRGKATAERLKAEGEIEGALAGLKIRSEVVCSNAFPTAGVLP